MKIGILTSTRADFGMYIPLIEELLNDSFFKTELIVFGSHLSKNKGYTINEIKNQGYTVKHKIDTQVNGDTPYDISKSIGETITLFADFWNKNSFDLIIALGDRYEMLAAVLSASTFNIKIAHLYAGETTLGAIDNAYRHSISLMSEYLFVSTENYKKRAEEINLQPKKVFNVGALSIDNLKSSKFLSKKQFLKTFNIDLSKPSILSTFHPETVSFNKNEFYIKELLNAFEELRYKYQIIITMPNSDTMGLLIRKEIKKFAENKDEIILIESFGMKGYLTCMKHCKMLIGNTSSGFGEAAFFPKWVINLGNRQKGRILTENIKTIPIKKDLIIKTVNNIENSTLPENCNIYGNGDSAIKIIKILKSLN